MSLPKLVRDKIPDIIRASGKECEIEILSGEDYIKALDAKLDEEVAEYHESHSLEELADIFEVILAIAYARGYSGSALIDARTDKFTERGGFFKRILLKEIKEKKDDD
jgi:predicted house-cleaning noncanonical NTP pyrophosphatase (MazG superfamily)